MNKSSREFDEKLLKSMIGLSIPIEDFENKLEEILKQKSSKKLWWDNKLTMIKDADGWHKVNYRCCPASNNARFMFCLVLETDETRVNIKEGYLEKI